MNRVRTAFSAVQPGENGLPDNPLTGVQAHVSLFSDKTWIVLEDRTAGMLMPRRQVTTIA